MIKNLKIFVSITLLVLVVIAVSISVIKPTEEQRIEDLWNALLQSKTVETEINNINALNKLMSSKQGSIQVVGNTIGNTHENMLSFTGGLDDIKSIDVAFYWAKKEFKGIRWKPLKKENLYVFFQE